MKVISIFDLHFRQTHHNLSTLCQDKALNNFGPNCASVPEMFTVIASWHRHVIVSLVSSGQHPVSAQSELHPAPAFQGSHFQRRLSQRGLPSYPGTAGSTAAPNLSYGG